MVNKVAWSLGFRLGQFFGVSALKGSSSPVSRSSFPRVITYYFLHSSSCPLRHLSVRMRVRAWTFLGVVMPRNSEGHAKAEIRGRAGMVRALVHISQRLSLLPSSSIIPPYLSL